MPLDRILELNFIAGCGALQWHFVGDTHSTIIMLGIQLAALAVGCHRAFCAVQACLSYGCISIRVWTLISLCSLAWQKSVLCSAVCLNPTEPHADLVGHVFKGLHCTLHRIQRTAGDMRGPAECLSSSDVQLMQLAGVLLQLTRLLLPSRLWQTG